MLDIETAAARVIHSHLHRRVRHEQVSANDVSLDYRSQIEAICVANRRILLDNIFIAAGALYSYAKIVALGRVSISTCPVRTEPAAAGAAK
jgi:hypothetical protein